MKAALERLAFWVRRVTGREAFEEAMSDELQAHIEMQADDIERRGVPRAEALRQARLAFGAVERYRQEGRDGSVYRFFDELHADLRDAFRGLKRDRSFSVVAVPVIASDLTATMVLFALLAGLKAPRKGLIGAWSHNYPDEGVPGPDMGFTQESLRWWDHWLKGKDTGVMAEPMRTSIAISTFPVKVNALALGTIETS